MNFFKPTIIKIIFIIPLSFLGISVIRESSYIIDAMFNWDIFVAIFTVIILIFLFIPFKITSFFKNPESQDMLMSPIGTHTIPLTDPDLIFQVIVFLIVLYLWICILFCIFKIIAKKIKKYLYEKYQKPRQRSL